MAFKQEKRTNILKCDGCNTRCTLGTFSNGDLNPNTKYKPTINGTEIESYINQNGFRTYTNWTSQNTALEQARTICRLCDDYQLPHLNTTTVTQTDKITTAIYLINEITKHTDIRKIRHEKTMALLYLLWLEYQSYTQRYSKIEPDSPMHQLQWNALEFGPSDNEILYTMDYIYQQIHNKQIPTIQQIGFSTHEKDKISDTCSNVSHNYAHAAPNELIFFIKYDLPTWQNTQILTPMFRQSDKEIAHEIDAYLSKRPKFTKTIRNR